MRIGTNDSIPGLDHHRWAVVVSPTFVIAASVPIRDFGPWAGLRPVTSIDGMTAVLTRPSPPATSTRPVDVLAELATVALHAALERRGAVSDRTRVELMPFQGRTRVIVYLRPSEPWRVGLAALAEVVSIVRMFDPSVILADSCFEGLADSV